MDDQRLDNFARTLASGTSRRKLLKGMLGGALGALGVSPAAARRPERVGICHRTGSGRYRFITVAEPALPAHAAHGDLIGDTSCPGDSVLDTDTCSCVCPVDTITCAGDAVANPATCACECDLTCAAPFVADDTACECVCGLESCPEGFTLNGSTCTCDPDATCDPDGQEELRCLKDNGTWHPDTCTCEQGCDELDRAACIKAGGTWHPDTCTCEQGCDPAGKGALECKATGGTWDPDTCTCDPGCDPGGKQATLCAETGGTWDPDACACIRT